MMNRILFRTFVALSVATTLVVGFAPAAHAAKIRPFKGSVSELKTFCTGGGRTYVESADGKKAACFSGDNKTINECDDTKKGNNCKRFTALRRPTRRVVKVLTEVLLAGSPSGSVRCAPLVEPTPRGESGGSTNTGTTSTTVPTTTSEPSTTTIPTEPSFL